jgi:hypothetical protein
MSGAKATTFSEWARELESISSVEIPRENMCEGENSREITEYPTLGCCSSKMWILTKM